jgi:UDP-N-acetylmuramate dehydrogenase
VGDAGVYAQHALVLVNHGQASGAELWALAEQVMQSVQARFGVGLQPEPVVLPPFESFPLTPNPSPACGRGG